MRKILLLLFLITLPVFAQVPIAMGTENAGNHFKVIFLADGFTSAEMSTFEAKATSIMNLIKAQAPFSSNTTKINFYRVNTVSVQSGVSVEASPGVSPVTKDTYWKVYINDEGMIRSHSMDLAKRNFVETQYQYLSKGKKVFAIIISNHTGYGGVGEFFEHNIDPALDNTAKVSVMITSMYSSPSDNGSNFVPLHEFGHSFGQLADEYFGEGAGGIDETYNIFNSTPRGQHLLSISGAKPNVKNFAYSGWIQGANYRTLGWWRSSTNDIMRGSFVWSGSIWNAPLTYDASNLALISSRITTEAVTKKCSQPTGITTDYGFRKKDGTNGEYHYVITSAGVYGYYFVSDQYNCSSYGTINVLTQAQWYAQRTSYENNSAYYKVYEYQDWDAATQ